MKAAVEKRHIELYFIIISDRYFMLTVFDMLPYFYKQGAKAHKAHGAAHMAIINILNILIKLIVIFETNNKDVS